MIVINNAGAIATENQLQVHFIIFAYLRSWTIFSNKKI